MRTLHKELSKYILADGFPIEVDLENSHGSYLKDQNGDEYLDMFSMFASSPIGYNHPHVVAQKDFLGKMAINKPAMSDTYPFQYADVVNTFARVAIPEELSYCFFISGGTLAVENALKVAFDWRTRLNISRGIQEEASQVIHFKQAFHGRSGYTLSLTNTKDPRKYMYFPKFDWPRILNPKLTFPLTEDSINETIELEKEAIRQIEDALHKNPNQVACLIIEPIQAEGGDNHFRKEFFKKLRQLCDDHEILLILDEVQTGLAMTGKMWAYQHYDIVPDVIAFGKKSQVCGILANRKKLDQVEHHVFKESSRINSTFGGNFIDMLRFKLILEVIEQEKLVDKAEKTGKYLLDQVKALVHAKPQLSNARGLGLMVSFDFENSEQRDLFVDRAFKDKLLILGCGEKSIRFRPHLTATIADIDKALSIVKQSL
ncbi:L-lysine 6-transaminase [Sphingobacterium sp. MYb382]|uniref:L-lysine 6-transaminase n=1 Tax=Sphingobacterium sp. MYb382 TaxID=2745278 RepID=UPI0030A39AEF